MGVVWGSPAGSRTAVCPAGAEMCPREGTPIAGSVGWSCGRRVHRRELVGLWDSQRRDMHAGDRACCGHSADA